MDRPDALPFTIEPEAQELLASQPLALLIGLVLYQQVPTEKAFAGPWELERRIGGQLDARALAATDPAELEEVFRTKPALHRFPANMAKRVQALCQHLVDVHDGDVTTLWRDPADASELFARLTAMPGFGDYKARIYLGLLSKWFGVRPDGYESLVPDWPTIVDVDTMDDLDDLRHRKRAWKQANS